jgi:hypothetical protein
LGALESVTSERLTLALRRAQSRNQLQDIGEQLPRHCDLGHLLVWTAREAVSCRTGGVAESTRLTRAG